MEKKYRNLRVAMYKYGDTQYTLAEVLNISQSAVNNRLAGRTSWTIREVKILCQRYKKPFEVLFNEGGEENG